MPEFTNTNPLILPQNVEGKLVGIKQEIPLGQIGYCLYARKSSEDDERQALSIDSQINEMTRMANEQGLCVIETRKESHSAKNSGQRPVFNQLIEDLRNGLFQGILTWAPDRLSRNAGDLGSLVDLMDKGVLREIKTHGQTLTNSPNDKFLLMILCSQAKLENDNRGVNVKRGMKTKCELGFRPNQAPLGYLNDYYSGKGQKKIYQDPERAPIIKEAFEKVAYHGYSGRDIYKWMKDVVDFRTRSGKFMTLSSVYRMLNNPYFCGMFEFPVGSGKWFKGAYEPIISRELFNEVQNRLTIHPKTKPGTKEFDFVKLLKCGSCGSGITAQEKYKKCKDGKHRYVYYHCTKAKDIHCIEPYLREDRMIEFFIKLLNKLPIEYIKSEPSLNEKLKLFQRFSAVVLGNNIQNDHSSMKIKLEDFFRYIFHEGTKGEKIQLLRCFKTTLVIKDRTVYLTSDIQFFS